MVDTRRERKLTRYKMVDIRRVPYEARRRKRKEKLDRKWTDRHKKILKERQTVGQANSWPGEKAIVFYVGSPSGLHFLTI